MTSVSVFACSTPSEFLKAVFAEKRAKNRAFSLRSFSKALGVPAASLSFVFSGKRNFSASTLVAIGKKLGLAPLEIEQLLLLQGVSSSNLSELRDQVERRKGATEKFKLDPKAFAEVSNWYSLVILEALDLPKFRENRADLPAALGLSATQVEAAFRRLVKLGVLERDAQGRYRKKGKHLLVLSEAPKVALRAYHKQMLGKAIETIRPETTHERYLGSEIFPFSKSALPEARKIIDRCLDDLIALSGRCESPDTLYQIGAQFFEILRSEKKS